MTTEPRIITHSDIKTFMACRRAWSWSEADYRLEESVIGNLAIGIRVHAAIEHYYRTGEDPCIEHERLFRADLLGVSGWQEDQLYTDAVVGRNCVRSFIDWLEDTGADAGLEVVDVEHQVSVPFLKDRVILRGKIDVLFRREDNGFLIINDNKTTGRWGSGIRAMLERSWQHDIYAIAMTIANPEENIAESCYTMLRKQVRAGKYPMVERFRVPGSSLVRPHKIKLLEQICVEMLEPPEPFTPRAYPCPSDHCNWCEYKKPCELAQDSLGAAEAMLESEYRSGGKRLRRYDVL